MNGKAKWVLVGWLVAGVLPLMAVAAIQDEPTPPRDSTPQADVQTHHPGYPADHPEMTADARSSLKKANELIGAKVFNDKGQRLGTIEDIVLNPDRNEVSYAVLSHGGFLGMGGKLFAVPWSEFKFGSQKDTLVLSNVDPSHLENAMGFDKNHWPTAASPNWLGLDVNRDTTTNRGAMLPDSESESMGPGMPGDTGTSRDAGMPMNDRNGGVADTRTYQATPGRNRIVPRSEGDEPRAAAEPAVAAKADIKYRRLSELVGLTIKNEQGEELGELEDIVLDVHQGKVAYAVLSMRSGFLGLNKDYVPVPWSAMNILPDVGTARLNADKQTLEAIAFKSDKFPNLEDQAYSRQLHERFGARPYWEALGFVPGEEGPRSSVPPWNEDSEYNSQYKAGDVKTIHGTIESVGTFRLEGTSMEGLRLRVKTDDGKTMTVHAGPRSYVDRQNVAFHYGDKVTVTGSPGKSGWRDVILASQIKVGDKTLDLRTPEGKPRWNADDFQNIR